MCTLTTRLRTLVLITFFLVSKSDISFCTFCSSFHTEIWTHTIPHRLRFHIHYLKKKSQLQFTQQYCFNEWNVMQCLTITPTSAARRSPFRFSTSSFTASVSSHTRRMSSLGLWLYPSSTCSYRLLLTGREEQGRQDHLNALLTLCLEDVNRYEEQNRVAALTEDAMLNGLTQFNCTGADRTHFVQTRLEMWRLVKIIIIINMFKIAIYLFIHSFRNLITLWN